MNPSHIYSSSNTLIGSGNVVAVKDRITNSNEGVHYISLANDNIISGLNVTVTVVAVRVKKKWKFVSYTETRQRKITEKQVVSIPKKVEKKIIPVLAGNKN